MSVRQFIAIAVISVGIIGGFTFLYFAFLNPGNSVALIAAASSVVAITAIITLVKMYRTRVK